MNFRTVSTSHPSNSSKMPAKRSRAVRSSAQIEAPVAVVNQVKHSKTEAAAETSQPKLTVASPEKVDRCDRVKIGGFLECCHYCKKQIAQNSEVFMYSSPYHHDLSTASKFAFGTNHKISGFAVMSMTTARDARPSTVLYFQ